MLAYHLRMDGSIPEGAVIFLGASNTQSLAVAAVTPVSINLGIGQQTTRLLLEAIPFYKSLHRAGAIVVSIGTNDILHDQAEGIEERLRQIDRALPANKPVIWSAIMPIRAAISDKKAKEAWIQSANKLIKALCYARERCMYVDTWQLLANGQPPEAERYFSVDGIHLSDAGYRQWILGLKSGLKAIGMPVHGEQPDGRGGAP